MRTRTLAIFMLILLLLLTAGCRIPPDVSNRETLVSLSFAPDPPTLGEAMAVVSVVTGEIAQKDVPITLYAIVNTVGIPPIEGTGTTDAEGHTVIPFDWTYGGDWIITVTAELPNGATLKKDFRYYVPDASA